MTILELGCGWGSLTLWMAAHYPRFARHRSLQFALAARSYRRRGRAPRPSERHRADGGHERIRDRRALRPRNIRGNVRAHEELAGALRTRRRLARAGRQILHARLRAPVGAVRLRSPRRERLDEPPFLFRRDDAERRSCRCASRTTSGPSRRWRWDGTHYEKTSNAWLANLDARRDEALRVLADVYGADAATQWLQRWRIFFMACAELFAYEHGQAWWVTHTLFERRA